jgi:protein SCO1/2
MVRQMIEGPAPEFVLVDQSGQPLALQDLRGKVVLLTFIYSACADVCPLITAAMTGLQQHLTARERPDVFFLSVTVEPEVDTPAVLQAYAEHHGADLTSWAFLTGSPPAVQAVWHAFGLTVKRRAEGGVDHPCGSRNPVTIELGTPRNSLIMPLFARNDDADRRLRASF